MFTKAIAKKLALKLIKELEANNIPIKHSYLFGSVVTNKNTEFSDIDIALISDIFTGFGYDDRKKINPYIIKINSCIEPHPFTSSEFTENNPFAKEVIRTGIKII